MALDISFNLLPNTQNTKRWKIHPKFIFDVENALIFALFRREQPLYSGNHGNFRESP